MKKALVIGLGVSGKSATAFLEKRGYDVTGYDDKLAPRVPAHLDQFDLVVVSPGIPQSHPLVAQLPHAIGEAELAFRYLKGPAVGITGTNGKTSVTLLVAHVLNELGIPAKALGNVGVPLTSFEGAEVAVIELSSYQLESLETRALDAALILNISPDHLDRHGSMGSYAAAKCRIQNLLREGAPLFVGEEAFRDWGELLDREKRIETIAPVEYERGDSLDAANARAAFALCQIFGVDAESFARAGETFRRPPHRREIVGTYCGVTYINDSKGTTVDAVLGAVAELEGPIVLIAGGLAKGASFERWPAAFAGRVEKVCLIGEASEVIERALGSSAATHRCASLEEAVEEASREAKKGTSVLLSPGCASFDMFGSYAERGDRFKEIVRRRGE